MYLTIQLPLIHQLYIKANFELNKMPVKCELKSDGNLIVTDNLGLPIKLESIQYNFVLNKMIEKDTKELIFNNEKTIKYKIEL